VKKGLVLLDKPLQGNVLKGFVRQRSSDGHWQYACVKFFQRYLYRTPSALRDFNQYRRPHRYLEGSSSYYSSFLESCKLRRTYQVLRFFIRRVLILPHSWIAATWRHASHAAARWSSWRSSSLACSDHIVNLQNH